MSHVNMNGVDIYFEEIGQGMPLLLLGDKGWEHHIWNPLTKQLQERFRIIMPEFRGSGRSPLGDAPLTATLLMEDMAFLLEYMNLYDVPVVGAGLGGKVAQLLASEFPERIESLILLNTSCGGAEGELYRPEALEKLFNLGSDTPTPELEELAELLLAPQAEPQTKHWLADCIKTYFPPKEVYQQQLLADAGCDLTEALRRMKPRVMVIAGKQDLLIDTGVLSRFVWMIPGGKYQQLEGGHLCMLTQAEACSELIQNWIKA